MGYCKNIVVKQARLEREPIYNGNNTFKYSGKGTIKALNLCFTFLFAFFLPRAWKIPDNFRIVHNLNLQIRKWEIWYNFLYWLPLFLDFIAYESIPKHSLRFHQLHPKCWFQAEDRVDELTKDLLQSRHRLQATEEEMRGKEEEAAMVRFTVSPHTDFLTHHSYTVALSLTAVSKQIPVFSQLKEVFRRELEKAEQEVRRSSGIITDYKQVQITCMYYCMLHKGCVDKTLMHNGAFLSAQICSQLTNRLERQEAAHRDELDSIKVRTGISSVCFSFTGI